MQKNPCRVDDPLQNPIDRESYEDAVSLEDGIYPITTDDNTIISSDMVSYGSGTVEQALNNIKSGRVTITAAAGAGTNVSVTFANPYPTGTNYSVQLTQQGAYAYSDLFLAVISRTNTGFTIQVGSDRSDAKTLDIAWLAVPVQS